MIDEDLLRDALSTLGTHPPVPADRVGAVRERVRRRARRRAALAGAAAVAVLGTVGAVVLPGLGDQRVTLPGREVAEVQVADYRVTITQAVVTLEGRPFPDAVQRVSDALEPTGLGRTVRALVDGQQDGPVRVDFDSRLDEPERARVRRLLIALPGAEVEVEEVPGFNLALVVPLSEPVRAELEARGAYAPGIGLGPVSDVLGGYSVVPDETRRRMTVEYVGPALSEADLASVRSQLARIAGVPVDRVRLEAGRQVR